MWVWASVPRWCGNRSYVSAAKVFFLVSLRRFVPGASAPGFFCAVLPTQQELSDVCAAFHQGVRTCSVAGRKYFVYDWMQSSFDKERPQLVMQLGGNGRFEFD